jgi:hypothetical protein
MLPQGPPDPGQSQVTDACIAEHGKNGQALSYVYFAGAIPRRAMVAIALRVGLGPSSLPQSARLQR